MLRRLRTPVPLLMPETLQPYLVALADLFYPEGRIGYRE
jgi:hypothetical protein